MGPGYEYTHFFSHLFNFDSSALLSLFLLGCCRLAPIVTLSPFLGAKLPIPVKMGLLLSFVVIFLPHIAMTSHTAVSFNVLFIAYAIKEIFIGFIIAFLAMVPFLIVQTSGVLIDFMRGASSLQVSDPFSSAQTSSIGNLYMYVLTAMFYGFGGLFLLFQSLFFLYTLLPVDAFLNPVFFTLEQPFWQTVTGVATKVTALSIQLAAPSLLAILMTEVFLGIANRLAPQVQIAFLGMAVKSLLGLTLLAVGWFFILQQVEKQTLLWMKEINLLLPFFSQS